MLRHCFDMREKSNELGLIPITYFKGSVGLVRGFLQTKGSGLGSFRPSLIYNSPILTRSFLVL